MKLSRRQAILLAVLIPLIVGSLVWFEIVRTRPQRESLAALSRLLDAGVRGDLQAARNECTRHFLSISPIQPAKEGGWVGLPRSIHPNFRTWRRDGEVWICPTRRGGPVYRFRPEAGAWKLDGLVGLLGADGSLVLESPALPNAIPPGPLR